MNKKMEPTEVHPAPEIDGSADGVGGSLHRGISGKDST